MFRRTEQGAEDTSTRDEHAYEDNWYRSLKALAEHRAAEEASEPSTDEPRGGPSEEGVPETADPVDSTGEPAAPLEVETDEVLEARVEEPTAPVVELPAPVEEPPMPAGELTVAAEVFQARVEEPAVPAEELRARVEELGVPVEASAPAPDVSEVEELSARTDQLIERLRTLRDADEVDRSTGEAAAGDPRHATSHEELGTRAQQLLERLRTLRTLGDAEEHRPRPEEHPSTGA